MLSATDLTALETFYDKEMLPKFALVSSGLEVFDKPCTSGSLGCAAPARRKKPKAKAVTLPSGAPALPVHALALPVHADSGLVNASRADCYAIVQVAVLSCNGEFVKLVQVAA